MPGFEPRSSAFCGYHLLFLSFHLTSPSSLRPVAVLLIAALLVFYYSCYCSAFQSQEVKVLSLNSISVRATSYILSRCQGSHILAVWVAAV